MGLENLPVWASEESSGNDKIALVIRVNSKAAYDEWLAELKPAEVDQYWLEVAYQCAKLDVQEGLAGSDYDPRTCGKPVEIRFSNAPEYALANFPPGRGVETATYGREARDHYVRIRGRMPF